MDNLCHTLAGAALAQAGLKRRTALATPTLLLAANLPDLDALAYLRDPLFALSFRRGWTHGVLAMAVLPPLLAVAILGWDRLVRLRRRPEAPPALLSELVLVSLMGVLSHPLLDLLNTYGVRLLMPFSGCWFYGDALFILDPWVWVMLGIGAGVSAWRARRPDGGTAGERPAQIALGATALYAAGMFAVGAVARGAAIREAAALGLRPERVMAAPVPLDPFRRAVLFDLGDRYRWGAFDWRRPAPRLVLQPDAIPRRFEDAAVGAALKAPAASAFLSWSRFPAAYAEPGVVQLYDLRYARAGEPSWAAVEIPVMR
ncbi:MAG TPA: metal-dependent hydrolase [Gemmatimonadales bacterium]|nr:metal-dependent hydrolase [Gemmatimonadales bacterium]